MTIAVALKVLDGIVLAADSATTLPIPGGGAANIYNHANKIANLRKGHPIGFMTWGAGGFGSASIATLAKDFRANWDQHVGPNYSVRDVASALRDELMSVAGDDLLQMAEGDRAFGFLVAGHKPEQPLGEAFIVGTDPFSGVWSDVIDTLDGDSGLIWFGDPRWIGRLVLGIDSPALGQALVDHFGATLENVNGIIETIQRYTEQQFVHPAMPIQDAIDCAAFLVDVTKGAVRFTPGAPVVGGPTEIAVITKHEGFKWVARKHYYDEVLNKSTREDK